MMQHISALYRIDGVAARVMSSPATARIDRQTIALLYQLAIYMLINRL